MNKPIRLILITLLLAGFLSIAHAVIAHAEHIPKAQDQFQSVTAYPEDDQVILQVLLDHLILSEGIIGLQHKDTIFLPLAEFSQALEFPIDIDPEQGTATGWFMDESRKFQLDLKKKRVTIAGQDHTFDSGQVKLGENDILVNIQTLEDWFPISLRFVQESMAIEVTSRERLPIEERLEREEKRGHLGKNNTSETESYRRVNTPYRLLSLPLANLTWNTSYSRDMKESFKHDLTALMAWGFVLFKQQPFSFNRQ